MIAAVELDLGSYADLVPAVPPMTPAETAWLRERLVGYELARAALARARQDDQVAQVKAWRLGRAA